MLKVICFIYAYGIFMCDLLQPLCYTLATPTGVILHLGLVYEGYSVVSMLGVYPISLPLRDRHEHRLCVLWISTIQLKVQSVIRKVVLCTYRKIYELHLYSVL